MTVLLLALSSAFFVGLNNVLIRKGLDYTSKSQAILISLVTSVSLFWIFTIILGKFRGVWTPAVFLFFLVGLLGPGIGRTFNILSLNRIGVSRTIPVTGIAPFFAGILAILFLGEEYSWYVFLGMAFIIFGIFVLTRRRENGLSSSLRGTMFALNQKDLFLPLASAFFGGFSLATTKAALFYLNEPLLGAAIALSTALLVVLGYIGVTGRLKTLRFTRAELTFPTLAGCSMAAAFFLNFTALEQGAVSVVAPVLSTFPLFGVFLSHLLLKEEITGRTWLGAAIIVIGIAFIQSF